MNGYIKRTLYLREIRFTISIKVFPVNPILSSILPWNHNIHGIFRRHGRVGEKSVDKRGKVVQSKRLLTKEMALKKITKKRMSADERRAQIVEVATALFAQKGFKGTTTREIAAKAGISEAIIFRHFSKKEDLYTAIVNGKCSDNDGHSLLLKALEGKRGRDVFREVATYLITEHSKDPTFMPSHTAPWRSTGCRTSS